MGLGMIRQQPVMAERGSGIVESVVGSMVGVAGITGGSGTLWSELSIARTGCGPLNLDDSLERGCYLVALLFAGLSVFVRCGVQPSARLPVSDEGSLSLL